MKKTAAALAALAAAGFTGLSTAPASAQMFQNCTAANNAGYYNIPTSSPAYSSDLDGNDDGVACEGGGTSVYISPTVDTPVVKNTAVFGNCTEARAAGRVNIPAGDPAYGLHLDADRDGFGCDADGSDDGVQHQEIIDWVPEGWANSGQGYDQVGQVPVGGADTGVEGEPAVPDLALAGGLTLTAAAGATVLVRRRATQG
ncbi:excalibur calcium-binding domain-containing protein [Kocuria nitroreducens]|uniref:excalibur calcium-binding domain-containing protein n=1 Tax=Kocuria nitroreducens TaxID=3058914 RepID=UPI0036D84C61